MKGSDSAMRKLGAENLVAVPQGPDAESSAAQEETLGAGPSEPRRESAVVPGGQGNAGVEADTTEMADPGISLASDEVVAMHLPPSAVTGRDFGRPDTPALLARLPVAFRGLHERMEQEFPGRDLSEIQVLAQTLLEKRSQFPDTLDDAAREALHAWTVETENLGNALVDQRAAELGLARSGIENDRGFWLAGFQDGKPAYTWTMNAAAAESSGVNLVRLVPSYDILLATPADGTSLYVNVNDHGTIYEHPEFQLPGGAGSRILFKEINDGGSRDHMTHVAGTVGAWGYTANLMGMAPRVWIRSHIQQYTSDITLHGMAWPGQRHSMTNPRTGELEGKSVMGTTSLGWDYSNNCVYEFSAASYDTTLRDYPYYTHFYAASNNGGTYATLGAGAPMAKNMITIGSVTDLVRDDNGIYVSGGNISGFSSRGPTFDGRIKPDLMGNGEGLTSPTTLTATGSKSGTSMATPNASGSATLLMSYIHTKLPGHYLRSSTIKALLVNSATDRGNAGPDYHYGWGVINVKAAADIVKRYAENPSSRVVHEDDLSPSQTWTQTYTYDGTGPIRVTVSWLDPAGTTQSSSTTDRSPRLVNNLNLRLIGPGGTTYFPYVMPFTTGNGTFAAYTTNLYSAVAVTGDNVTDNTEQVYIAAPPAGTYTLQISHAGSLQNNNPQPFSLAVSGLAANVPTHSVASVSPTIGDASDNFILSVTGANFGLGFDVILRRAGSVDAEAYGEIILQDKITCRVDTAALAKGYWDIVVRGPDGSEALLPNAFLLPVSGGSGAREAIYANTFENGTTGLTLGTGWSLADPNKSTVSGPADPQQGSSALVTYAGGNYPGNITSYAVFPAVSTLGYSSIRVEFQRWLGLVKQGNSTDYGRVQYSTDGTTWTTHTSHSNLNEGAWALRTYDLPIAAEGKATLYVRFSLETDANNHSYGWNIDDFKITGASSAAFPPVFSSMPPASGTQGLSFSYTASVSDADTAASSLAFSATGLPAGLSFVNNGNGSATLSGTPSASGVFEVSITVTDGSYTTHQIFDLPIFPEGGNTAPVITTSSLPDAFVGDAYAASIAATDADGHALSLSIGTKPFWLTFSDNGNGSASLGGTPPVGSNGSFNLTFSAFDGFQSVDKTLVLSVRPRAVIGFSASSVVAGEATGSLALTVRRSEGNYGPVSVSYASANGSASAGVDYSAVSGTLTWADGDTADKTITVPILDDDLSEVDETFSVSLSNLTGIASLGTSTVTVTIDDNENNALVYVQVTDADCGEDSNDGTFTLYRTGDSAAAMTVTYSLSGTATNGTDYALRNGTATINAGSVSTAVLIDVSSDSIYEGDETVVLTVEPGVSYNVGEPAEATIILKDNDKPTVSVSASATTVSEDVGSVVLTFSRSGTTEVGPLTVTYTLGGTASVGADYVPFGTSVTIPIFESSQTVHIPIINDDLIEAAETITLTIATQSAYNNPSTNNPALTLTLRDDTEPIVLLMGTADNTASEPAKGDGNGSFRITRWGNPGPALTVNLTPPTGSATNGVDYSTLPASILLPADAITVDIPLTVIDDAIAEIDEVVTLGIAGGVGYTVGNAISANINLYDDEPVQVRLEISDDKALEASTADTGKFRFRRYGLRTAALSINYSISGTATNGTDYSTIASPISLGANSGSVELTITPINDTLVEGSESVILTIDSVSVGTVAASPDNSATLWIRDDETLDVNVAVQDAVCAEGATPDNGSFRISRSASSATELVVNYTLGGTAANGTDYTSLTGTAILPANATNVDVIVTPINDALVEGGESVILTLSLNAAAYDIGDNRSATLWIRDDETPTVTLTAPDASAAESDGGETDNGQWLFSASSAPASDLTLRYTIATGTGNATNGMDYAFLPGTLVLPAGQTSVTLDLVPFDDELVEGAETIALTLQQGAGYSVATLAAVNVVITASDTPSVRVFASLPNAGENPVVAGQFRFETDKIFSGNTNILYFMSGTATNASDYSALSGSIQINSGSNTASLTLTPINDSESEGAESAILTISDAGAYVVASGGRSATITIADDEADGSRNLLVTPIALSVAEGGTATFSVALDTAPAADLTVTVAYASGDSDLSVQSGAFLTFTPGNWSTPQTVTLAAATDVDADPGSATFQVSATGHPTVTVAATESDKDAAPAVRIVHPGISPVSLPDLSDSLLLIAEASDTVGTPALAWTQVSGPGTTVFSDSTSALTRVSFPEAGTYVLRVTATDADSQASTADVTVLAGDNGALWTSQSLGAFSYAGSSARDADRVILDGAGGDISGTADRAHFLHTALTGDFDIRARVASIQPVIEGYTLNGWAKAGLMLRQSTDAGSMTALAAMTPGNGFTFAYRTSSGASSGSSSQSGLVAPHWVRLKRSGNAIEAFRSADGVTWTKQGSTQTLSMTNPVLVGFTVCSGNINAAQPRTVFDNITGFPSGNAAPQVDPGPFPNPAANATTTLTGSILDDGQPAGEPLSIAWTKLSGPGVVTFGDANAAVTTASFSADGVYLMRLEASDGLTTVSEDLALAVGQTTRPELTRQPQPLAVFTGESVSFTVSAFGSLPMTYQWRKNGQPIQGAIDPTFTISIAEPGDAGLYDVQVFNNAGSETSASAALVVNQAPLHVEEYFNYGGSDLNSSYGTWQSGTTVVGYKAAPNLAFSNSSYSIADNIGGSLGSISNSSVRGVQTQFTNTAPTGTFWVSTLMRKGNTTDNSFMLLALNDSSTYSNSATVNGGFGLGANGSAVVPIYRTGAGTQTKSLADGFSINTDYLVIAKITVTSGTDSLRLWVKKEADSFGSTEASLGAPALDIASADFGASLRNLWAGQINTTGNIDAIRISSRGGDAGLADVLGTQLTPTTPTVSAWPTASGLDYGQTLAASVLNGGTASVAGSFAFAAPATLPAPGTANHDVVFTPADSTNYNTVTGSVSVSVSNLESGSLRMVGGSTPGMSIPSSTALRYRLQYKNNLLDPAWLDFNPLLWTDGTGAVLEMTDPSSDAPIRFYILVAEPKP